MFLMEAALQVRRSGRPLSFDRDVALRQAMLVFWRYGYESASVTDLTRAMGVTAPSLYTAFGDKKRLFLKAVRLYAGDPQATAESISLAPSAYEAARQLMTNAACAYTGEETPRGCLLASATASGSAASADVQRAVADIRRSESSGMLPRAHCRRELSLPACRAWLWRLCRACQSWREMAWTKPRF